MSFNAKNLNYGALQPTHVVTQVLIITYRYEGAQFPP